MYFCKIMILTSVFVITGWKHILAIKKKKRTSERSERSSMLQLGPKIICLVSDVPLSASKGGISQPILVKFCEQSLQVIPERGNVAYINDKYLYNATVNVRRYGRKSAYYLNIEGFTKMPFGNNVSLTLIFFEFLHNEYKRSFVEMKFPKICDSIKKDPYVGKAFKQIGVTCPLPAGVQKLMNVSLPMHDFPNVWPFEKCKAEATLVQNINGDVIAVAEIYALFKQKPKLK